MDIRQEPCSLPFGAVDRSGRLTPASAFELFQEAAVNHAEELGVGREALEQTGRAWILSRITVLMDQRPRWKDAVTVRSWPRGWEKLFALRDYDIRDSADRPLVRGRSGWLVLDLEKRRPLRPQSVMEGLPLNEGIDALHEGPPALEERSGLCETGERRASYSDIDYNGHVNNARYIQWIQDLIDPAVLEGAGTIRLDVNYLSEVKYGDLTLFWNEEIPLPEAGVYRRGFAFEGRRSGDGTAVFRAELRTC